MAPTKVLNCSHGQALSFEHSQYEQLAKGRALRQFTPSGSLKKSSFLKKNFVLYPTKILLKPGECNLRYAHDSLRSNHVSKLGIVFEKELGVVDSWSSTLRIGNPVRSDLVTQYMAFTTGEHKQAGVLVKQAPTILRSNLAQILFPMRTQLQITTSDVGRVTLSRDIAFFTVAFSTTKRGAELTATLIQRILRLSNKSGLMFNFQYGKTQRDGADHILTVPYDEEYVAVCPVRAVTQLIDIGKGVG